MSQPAPRWSAPAYGFAEASALAAELGLSLTTATVLVRRGLRDAGAARAFLDATEIHDPDRFGGIEGALELLERHVEAGGPIAVHGDYDVDGVCSTALLVRALRDLGAEVRPRLPSREEGYGLSARTVEELAGNGARLLLTVDCGIGSVAEVELAGRLGMDVIVTDHHRPGAQLPDCPIVHPVVGGYPCPELCATAVAYKLVQALQRRLGRDCGELERELELVALATVADVVPLLGENRTLVRAGMRKLSGTARPGLRALMKVAGVDPQSVGERALAFALAPRINAAGRLYRADAGLELLLTDDLGRALEIARELDAVNTERQAVETRILFEAERKLSAEDGQREDPILLLAGEQWHPGVIGIVASRLVERYQRPCVLVALDGAGGGRGSGRSIPAYDLHAGLESCAQHLTRFGGHRMAAGLEVEADRLDDLRAALVQHARSCLRAEQLVRVERVDAIVPGDGLDLELASELDRLRPFGMGNPGVNLLLPAVRVGDVHTMGEGRHARFVARSAGVRTPVVAFGFGATLGGRQSQADDAPRHDLVARLEANEWRGAVEPRLVLRSIHPIEPSAGCAGASRAGCAGCSCRARGADWWRALWQAFEQPGPGARRRRVSGALRLVVDARGRGIVGSLGELVSGGESLAIVTADCSRRRHLAEQELRGERFGRAAAIVLSERCSIGHARELLAGAGADPLLLVDYATLDREPELLVDFTHVFALDPPPLPHLDALLRAGAVGEARFLHLGWGQAELELAARALEQDFGLRGPLAAIYRALAGIGDEATAEQLEAALAGEGRHPRAPALVGRCLRVLADLSLVELERSSATVRCTITGVGGSESAPSKPRVDLERSETFRAYASLYEEGSRFLRGQAQQEQAARAA